MSRRFNSGFAEELDGMIDLKVALGYSEGTYVSRATSFDRYCTMICPDATELTKSIVIGWLKPDIRTSAKGVHNDAAFARAFGNYLRATGKDAYVIPENYTAGRSMFIPYLFADEELTELFHVIDTYEDSRHPFEPAVLSTYFRLTYTCGLRPNEGRNLKRNEVDLSTGEVFIIDSKWKKSRTVVMSEDMLSLIKTYTTVRDTVFPDNEYLFPRPDGKPYTSDWMGKKFKKFFAMSKPNVPEDLIPPVRVYDLRHRFATAVLNRWLDEKMDLSSRLPYLQTYMGHKELSATAYYIHLLPENLVKSAGIDWSNMNSMIPEVELWEN